MKRKEFLKKSAEMALASGALCSLGCCGVMAQTSTDKPQTPTEAEKANKFQQQWLKTLIELMDSQLDKKSEIKLLESCGRACARRGAVDGLGKASGGDINKLVEVLGTHLGKENVTREGNTINLTYSKCYCPMVSAGPERLPASFCNCSRGWAMEVFGSIHGKSVEVELLQSIKAGAPSCKFLVKLS
jgi:predicted hydrocarbon binding protein